MELKIRNAKKEDLIQINKIAKQVHDLHITFRPDVYVSNDIIISEERYNELLADGIIFVGENNNKIVSYAICLIKNLDNPVMVKRKIMYIDTIGNDENYRNCGIGKKMIKYIFNYAKENGCNRVELQVNTNNKNAIGFYEHLGMKEKSRRFEIDL